MKKLIFVIFLLSSVLSFSQSSSFSLKTITIDTYSLSVTVEHDSLKNQAFKDLRILIKQMTRLNLLCLLTDMYVITPTQTYYSNYLFKQKAKPRKK